MALTPFTHLAKTALTALMVCGLAFPMAPARAAPSFTPGQGTIGIVIKSLAAELEAQLDLTPPQRLQLVRAVAVTQDVVPELLDHHAALAEAARAEFENPIPDLDSLAAQRDALVLDNLALRQSARAEWLALYHMLTPEQVAVLKDWVAERRARGERMRAVLSGMGGLM